MANEMDDLDKIQSPARRFLIGTGVSFLGAVTILGGWIVLKFLGYHGPRSMPGRFVVGHAGEFPMGKLVLRKGVWIGHDKRGLYGLVNICTHLGCHPRWAASRGLLECPCHGSRFDLQGRVLKGPARKPLKRPGLAWGKGKEIVVDLGTTVGEDFRLLL